MNKQKQIVIINQVSGYLMVDIANAFVDSGYKVTLIAGEILERNIRLNNQITIRKIASYNRKSVLMRFISWLSGFAKSIFFVLKFHKNEELLIVSNPPIALFIPYFCKNKFNFLIFDVYVESLEKFMPLKKFSPIVIIWKSLHRLVLNRANSVTVLTEGMKNVILSYMKTDNIRIMPLWTDSSFIKPVNKIDNPFVEKYNLKDKFTILYSGNLGMTSGIENILKLADYMKNDDRFQFVIIGEGFLRLKVESIINSKKMYNSLVLPYQNYDVLPYSLTCADVSIVALSGKSSNMSIPSKTFNYLSAGSAILCFADPKSDISKFVDKWKIGKAFGDNEIENVYLYLIELLENSSKLNEYKENAINLSLRFTPENAKYLISML